jgi:hypothetical protein
MSPLLALDPTTQHRWVATLVAAAVIIAVVTFLLHRILVAAREIHRLVGAIWIGGKRIAANTVNIAGLERTNYLASILLGSAGNIASSAARISKATKS